MHTDQRQRRLIRISRKTLTLVAPLVALLGLCLATPALADVPGCTPSQCSQFKCASSDPYVCTAGQSAKGCSPQPWNPPSCTAQCDLSKCASIPNPPPACTESQCLETPCTSPNVYACTAGSARGGCSSDPAHWHDSPGGCTQACDISKCSSVLPANPVCTQAQCDALQQAGHFCGAWGAQATPYACANSHNSNFGGCSADSKHWQTSNCGEAGCDTRVCNWAAVVPHDGAKPATADRTLTFENKCPFNIVVGYVGGAVKNANNKIIDCADDGDCPSGTRCMTATETLKYCYWQMPSSFDGARNLKANTGESSVTLTNPSAPFINDIQIKWSGNVWAHGECDSSFEKCKTAICPTGGCAANVGPTGPVTLAEFTLQNNAQDYYDISAINGINLPIMMAPTLGTGEASVYPPAGNAKQYWCSAPGDVNANGQLKAASWNVGSQASAATLIYYRYVDTSGFGQACTKAKDPACTGGSVCGLSYDSAATPATKLQCGKLIGWWSAGEICGVNAAQGFQFGGIDCNSALPVPSGYPSGAYADKPRQADVLLCQKNPAAAKSVDGTFNHSCYLDGAKDDQCCGCKNWDNIVNTGSCNNISNASWTEYALPWTTPIKKAAPTVYSYQFDDKTSTFNCYVESKSKIKDPLPQQANETNYTITFCPGKVTIQSMQ